MIIQNLIFRLLVCADSLPLATSSLDLGRIHLEAGPVELDHGSRKIGELLEFASSLKLLMYSNTDMAKKTKDWLRDIARRRQTRIATRDLRGSA